MPKKIKRNSRRPAQQVGGSGRVLRLDATMEKCGLSRSGIYRGMAEGTFPQSIHISARAVGWSEQSINEWIEARLAAVA
jgi:prophage regulatory protein